MKIKKILCSTLTFLCLTSSGFGQDLSMKNIKDSITTIGVKTLTPRSDAAIELGNQEEELRFNTNTGGVYVFFLGTKWLDLSISQPTKSAKEELKNTKYTDLHFKFKIGNFQLMYHKGQYNGAYVNEGPLTKDDSFFDDYNVDLDDTRLTYFFNSQFNQVINSPLKGRKIQASTGQNFYSSWSLGVGHNNSVTTFPKLGTVKNDNIVQSFLKGNDDIEYIDELDSSTTYLHYGYSFLHMLGEKFSYQVGIFMGNGAQKMSIKKGANTKDYSGTSRYTALDLGFSYLIAQKHNIGILGEQYTHSTDITSNTTINNNSSITSINYQYFF